MAYAATAGRRRRKGSGLIGRILVVLLGMIVAGLAAAPVAYMLWPAPVPISPDAPSLPVSVGGVSFNVPPGAIRFKMQRKPGAHPRIDMTFVWPSLTPPDPAIKPLPTDTPDVNDRLFVTIAATDATLSPMERLRTIYPRYLDAAPVVGRRAQHPGVPRRHRLPGRGPDPRSGAPRAVPAPLHAARRP